LGQEIRQARLFDLCLIGVRCAAEAPQPLELLLRLLGALALEVLDEPASQRSFRAGRAAAVASAVRASSRRVRPKASTARRWRPRRPGCRPRPGGGDQVAVFLAARAQDPRDRHLADARAGAERARQGDLVAGVDEQGEVGDRIAHSGRLPQPLAVEPSGRRYRPGAARRRAAQLGAGAHQHGALAGRCAPPEAGGAPARRGRCLLALVGAGMEPHG
jgi:hypothetical protein